MIDLKFLKAVYEIALDAGDAIMNIYNNAYNVEKKADGTPITIADRIANDIICDGLKKLTPELTLLSEESVSPDSDARLCWTRYWLIDPLDGTKEFIKGNGEFTVNIALIDKGRPILGVVHCPVNETTYFAATGKGSWRKTRDRKSEKIATMRYEGGQLRAAVSRSHSSSSFANYCLQLEQKIGCSVEQVPMGSSLKFCLVAEGSVDIYPRLGPTSEWDTAAAHCILEEAGGSVRLCNGDELIYNKKNIVNPWFLAVGDPKYDWIDCLFDDQS
ncbi:MAG: 3'(2'),5'-bisphosphate nucleotidase [Acidiferrobacteraceae bacterium]|nr:3'(2'),5'-bisphosphate nucleotidase [Acidiferrobacteraceae bacterium]|tara:strand:+ start:28939 stop:29757 length:819 start_codon:yes stop_codon:yes gene_type:complete